MLKQDGGLLQPNSQIPGMRPLPINDNAIKELSTSIRKAEIGAGDGIRTHDLLLVIDWVVLYRGIP